MIRFCLCFLSLLNMPHFYCFCQNPFVSKNHQKWQHFQEFSLSRFCFRVANDPINIPRNEVKKMAQCETNGISDLTTTTNLLGEFEFFCFRIMFNRFCKLSIKQTNKQKKMYLIWIDWLRCFSLVCGDGMRCHALWGDI